MYAAHKKNINRHKSFHPLTGQNLEKIEKRLAEKDHKEVEQTQRKATLRRERDDDLIAELEDVSAGLPSAGKGRRVDWVFSAEEQATPSVPSASVGKASATGSSTSKPDAGVETTGVVTAAETLKARQELERLRKLKNDPMAKIQQHRDAMVAEAAKAMRASAGASGTASSSALQARLQSLLDRK